MWKEIEYNCNYSINEQGQLRNNTTGQLKKPTLNKCNGYLVADLYRGNVRKKVPIHRLVAEAFIPNPENKKTVDHIDGDRTNNNVSNLRWATYSEQNSRFKSRGVRSEHITVLKYKEERKKRGGGHIRWLDVEETLKFDSITKTAEYFNKTISNISQMLKEGTIGQRGTTRGYQFLYSNSERKQLKKV